MHETAQDGNEKLDEPESRLIKTELLDSRQRRPCLAGDTEGAKSRSSDV
jgi:hypothetical protein